MITESEAHMADKTEREQKGRNLECGRQPTKQPNILCFVRRPQYKISEMYYWKRPSAPAPTSILAARGGKGRGRAIEQRFKRTKWIRAKFKAEQRIGRKVCCIDRALLCYRGDGDGDDDKAKHGAECGSLLSSPPPSLPTRPIFWTCCLRGGTTLQQTQPPNQCRRIEGRINPMLTDSLFRPRQNLNYLAILPITHHQRKPVFDKSNKKYSQATFKERELFREEEKMYVSPPTTFYHSSNLCYAVLKVQYCQRAFFSLSTFWVCGKKIKRLEASAGRVNNRTYWDKIDAVDGIQIEWNVKSPTKKLGHSEWIGYEAKVSDFEKCIFVEY